MQNWKKYTFLNAGMLIGFIISILIIPGTTRFWVVVAIAGAYVCYMNYSLHRRLAAAAPPRGRSHDWSVTIIVILLLILDILFSRL